MAVDAIYRTFRYYTNPYISEITDLKQWRQYVVVTLFLIIL
jgi:hypothetical protein